MDAAFLKQRTRYFLAPEGIPPLTLAGGVLFLVALFSFDKARVNILDYPIVVAVVAAVLASALTYAESFDFFRYRASHEAIYLAAEASNEAGPSLADYKKAIEIYKELLNRYIENFKDRARLIRYILPQCRVQELKLAQAARMLAFPVKDLKEAQAVVDGVAQLINRFAEDLYGRVGSKTYNYGAMLTDHTFQNIKDANTAMLEFAHAVKALSGDPTFENFQTACLKSRVAGAILHSVWPEYKVKVNDLEKVNAFKADLARARQITVKIGPELGIPVLEEYAHSLKRRVDALEALLNDDKQSLHNLLSAESKRSPAGKANLPVSLSVAG